MECENSDEQKEDHVKLSDAIVMFPDQKLSDHADIFNGKQLHGCFASLPIVVKLVDESSKREATILQKLNHHRNVISLIEAGVYDGGLEIFNYIAIDKCHEENLRDFIENRSDITLDRKLDILRQIITGVEYIHSKNIAHLDLKPGNILFTLDLSTIKIADFGLSEEISGKKTFVKHQFGTNGFRPPESFGKSHISFKTDIFPLGVVFYFVLSNGKNPFGEDSDGQNMNMKKGEVDLSCLLVPNCETAKHLIKQMLELKRCRRPTITQVSDHPFWSGNEVECDFDYETDETSDSDSCTDEEEPVHNPDGLVTLLELQKKYSTKDEATKEIKDDRILVDGGIYASDQNILTFCLHSGDPTLKSTVRKDMAASRSFPVVRFGAVRIKPTEQLEASMDILGRKEDFSFVPPAVFNVSFGKTDVNKMMIARKSFFLRKKRTDIQRDAVFIECAIRLNGRVINSPRAFQYTWNNVHASQGPSTAEFGPHQHPWLPNNNLQAHVPPFNVFPQTPRHVNPLPPRYPQLHHPQQGTHVHGPRYRAQTDSQ